MPNLSTNSEAFHQALQQFEHPGFTHALMVDSKTGDLKQTNIINYLVQKFIGFVTGTDWTSREVVELAALKFIAKGATNHLIHDSDKDSIVRIAARLGLIKGQDSTEKLHPQLARIIDQLGKKTFTPEFCADQVQSFIKEHTDQFQAYPTFIQPSPLISHHITHEVAAASTLPQSVDPVKKDEEEPDVFFDAESDIAVPEAVVAKANPTLQDFKSYLESRSAKQKEPSYYIYLLLGTANKSDARVQWLDNALAGVQGYTTQTFVKNPEELVEKIGLPNAVVFFARSYQFLRQNNDESKDVLAALQTLGDSHPEVFEEAISSAMLFEIPQEFSETLQKQARMQYWLNIAKVVGLAALAGGTIAGAARWMSASSSNQEDLISGNMLSNVTTISPTSTPTPVETIPSPTPSPTFTSSPTATATPTPTTTPTPAYMEEVSSQNRKTGKNSPTPGNW